MPRDSLIKRREPAEASLQGGLSIRFAVPSLLLVVLFALPLAAAQAPSMTVTITGAPAEFPALASNSTALAAFKVEVTLSNVICPQATTIPVTITATPKTTAAFFTAAPEPATVEIPVTAGPHGSPPAGSPATGSADAAVKATTTVITANASIPVEIVATAAAPAGCQGAGGVSGATSAPVTVFANLTAPPPPPVEEPPAEENGLPGPGVLMGTIAAFVAAALRRRAA